MHTKVCIDRETLKLSTKETLAKHQLVLEAWHCRYWVRPFLVKIIGRDIGYVDFEGRPHRSDICAYGTTIQEALEEALDQFER